MKKICMTGTLAAGMILAGSYMTRAQDVPGFSVGGFAETRVENKIAGETLGFSYYGARLKVRDERFIEAFADIGMQSMDLKPYTADDKGSFGLGLTFWLIRSEDELVIPADIGLYTAYYVADHSLELDAAKTDVKYGRLLVQGVIRSERGAVSPFLRAGIQTSKLVADNKDVLNSEGTDVTKPAVNVGVEWKLSEMSTLSLEGNYSESVGAAVHLDLWF